ncbi:MAG TPA: sulfatase [Verrucomicrobiota bacterium]|nr:sulfatase [Verrucomicrobiota bacterium]HNU50750.1 sulfatase [Verrucomicrobiota bacterium]
MLAALLWTPLSALCAADAPPVAGKPNVLFIAIDDLRTSLGCYGDNLAKSPNIDRLAQSSRLFLGAYTHQAVCGPARTAILTGRLPDNTRVWHNRNLFRDTLPDAITLPQLFKNNGYQALSFGKIFSGAETELDPPSWSAPEVLRGAGPGWKNYALPGAKAEGKGAAYEVADVADEGYPDGNLAKLAVATLEKLEQQKAPFFLAVGFFKPHLPFNAPKRYWDLYDPAVFALKDQTRVKGAPEIAYHTHRELGGYKEMPEDEHVSAEQARALRHGYYACVSYVDAQVGKVLDALQRLGLDQNTIVVLWGDHGWSLGEKDRWCKGTNFERDTRVPLMIRTPGLAKAGAPAEALIEYVDIYPTLAALSGLTPPADLDGRSMVPILQDPGAHGRDVAFSQYSRPWKATGFDSMGYTLRTATQRYTRWVEWPSRKTLIEEFYDYTSMPSTTREGAILIELENVVADPAYAEAVNRLRATMDETLSTRIKLKAEQTPATAEPKVKKKKKKSP